MADPSSPQSPYSSPVEAAAPGLATDATGGIIPYKNPKALIAYYLGVFSLIPLLGAPLAPVAVGLGIWGLRDRQRNRVIRGGAHAWAGIVLGTLVMLGYVSLLGFGFFG